MTEDLQTDLKKETESESTNNLRSKKTSPTLSLVEAALMAALCVICGLSANYVGILAPLIFPLPIAVLVVRHNVHYGVLAVVVSTIVLSMFLGIPYALILAVQFSGLGLFFGYCLQKKVRPMITILGGTVLAAIGTIGGVLLTQTALGFSTDMYNEINSIVDSTIAMYQNVGLLDLAGTALLEFKKQMVDVLTAIIPGAMIVVAMIMTLLNYLLFTYVLKRLHYAVEPLPKFRDWHFDWRLIWGFMLGLACVIAGKEFAVHWLTVLGGNLIYIYIPILMLGGFSLVVWIFKMLPMPFFKMFLIMMLILMFQSTLIFLVVVGIIDPFFDFRGRFNKKINKA